MSVASRSPPLADTTISIYSVFCFKRRFTYPHKLPNCALDSSTNPLQGFDLQLGHCSAHRKKDRKKCTKCHDALCVAVPDVVSDTRLIDLASFVVEQMVGSEVACGQDRARQQFGRGARTRGLCSEWGGGGDDAGVQLGICSVALPLAESSTSYAASSPLACTIATTRDFNFVPCS